MPESTLAKPQRKNFIKILKNIDANELRGFSIAYTTALIFPIVSLLLTLFLIPIQGKTALFLLFFPSITLVSWYGGRKPGIFASVFSTILVNYFILSSQNLSKLFNTVSLFQSALFLLSGMIITFVVDASHQTDVVKRYKMREKEIEARLAKLEAEYLNAQHEIKARDEFLSIASHELKTPLTSMLLKLQTALHNVRNVSLANFSVENLLKMLESAEQQSVRLSRMINDLLNVSLITSGRLDLEREEVDLSQTTKDVIDRFSERLEKDGYLVSIDAKDTVVGHWDKLRIEQVLANLISNAIKYGQGKPISLQVCQNSRTAKLTVIDHGIGIEEKEYKRIFERFERAVSTQNYKGLGVGLYITHQIVKAHGGSIDVSSTPGKETKFTIELPFKKEEDKH